MKTLLTVAETPNFQRITKSLFTEAEVEALVDSLAETPDQGVELGSGIRKLRFGRKGAYRVIYFWYGAKDVAGVCPLFLLHAYRKSRQGNLTDEQLKAIREVGNALTEAATARFKAMEES